MRVSIARALSLRPKLLLMDEPFAALDEITRFRLNDDLLRLQRDLGCTVVFVTHSVYESVYLSSPHRRHGGAARARRRRDPRRRCRHRRDEGFRATPLYADLCRTDLRGPARRHGRRTSTCERRRSRRSRGGAGPHRRGSIANRVLKIGLPLA